MLLNEPPRTPYDWSFRLLGIPVRVHPLFWAVTLLLGLGGNPEPVKMLFWVGVAFVSILIHEMGHALAARAFGWPPRITLHGMGGLASYQPTHHSKRAQILITAAGPGAGFLFALLIVVAIKASGHAVQVEWPPNGPLPVHWELYESYKLNLLILDLLFINIFWGLINLLPIYPLDGGQIAREVLGLINPGDAVRQSLWLSLITAAVVAVLALLKLHDQFLAFFFAYLAYISYSTLQANFGPGGGLGGYR